MGHLLLSRRMVVAACWIGVLQILFGTCLALCGFIELGMYHRLSGDGFWTGFPLLIPGFLAVIALATRRRESMVAFFFLNLVVLGLCIAHAVVSHKEVDHWKKYKNYVLNNQCYERGDICSCPSDPEKNYYVQRCNLFSFGHDLYWAFFAFNIVGAVLSAVGVLLGAVGICREDKQPKEPQY